jgi:hypothetical protein
VIGTALNEQGRPRLPKQLMEQIASGLGVDV